MRTRTGIAAGSAALLLAGGMVALGTGPALAYGAGAVHQVEISANIAPNFFGPGTGGGIWLWIELDGSTSGGGGDYTGSDCLHRTPIPGTGTGAFSDAGDVTWSLDTTTNTITILGVTIGDPSNPTPLTIQVPESGHEALTNLAQVFIGGVPPVPASGQVQVTS